MCQITFRWKNAPFLTAIFRETNVDVPRKRRKVEAELKISEADWERFEKDVDEFDLQHAQGKGKFTFDFVEGPLVRALRAGDWYVVS
jgi:midasin